GRRGGAVVRPGERAGRACGGVLRAGRGAARARRRGGRGRVPGGGERARRAAGRARGGAERSGGGAFRPRGGVAWGGLVQACPAVVRDCGGAVRAGGRSACRRQAARAGRGRVLRQRPIARRPFIGPRALVRDRVQQGVRLLDDLAHRPRPGAARQRHRAGQRLVLVRFREVVVDLRLGRLLPEPATATSALPPPHRNGPGRGLVYREQVDRPL